MNHYKDQGWLALIHFLQWCFTTYIVWQVQLQGWQKTYNFGHRKNSGVTSNAQSTRHPYNNGVADKRMEVIQTHVTM